MAPVPGPSFLACAGKLVMRSYSTNAAVQLLKVHPKILIKAFNKLDHAELEWNLYGYTYQGLRVPFPYENGFHIEIQPRIFSTTNWNSSVRKSKTGKIIETKTLVSVCPDFGVVKLFGSTGKTNRLVLLEEVKSTAPDADNEKKTIGQLTKYARFAFQREFASGFLIYVARKGSYFSWGVIYDEHCGGALSDVPNKEDVLFRKVQREPQLVGPEGTERWISGPFSVEAICEYLRARELIEDLILKYPSP